MEPLLAMYLRLPKAVRRSVYLAVTRPELDSDDLGQLLGIRADSVRKNLAIAYEGCEVENRLHLTAMLGPVLARAEIREP